MAKHNLNALAVVESVIADEIRSIPEVSGMLDGDTLAVFASCEEDFAAKLEFNIQKALGHTVAVYTNSVDEPRRNGAALAATAHLTVEVSSNGLLTDDKKKSTSDIALVIIAELEGSCYEAPFTPMPVLYAGSEIYENAESYIHSARFDVQFLLKPNR